MPSVKNVLSMRFVPEQTQFGLAVLRVCTGLSLFLHHGWEKRPAQGAQFTAYCFGNIFVAWAFVHHFAFLGKGPGPEHGELIALYLAALLTLLIAGPGSASLDRLLARKP